MQIIKKIDFAFIVPNGSEINSVLVEMSKFKITTGFKTNIDTGKETLKCHECHESKPIE